MPTTPDAIGALGDRVQLRLGGSQILIAESYDVKVGVLTQPTSFSAKLGSADTVRELIQAYPPNTKFELYVNEQLQFRGFTDGYDTDDGDGTGITIMGRDVLARLHDAYVRSDISLGGSSYQELVLKALDNVGLKDATLFASADAMRSTRSGLPIHNTKDSSVRIGRPNAKPVQCKVGDRWYQTVKRELDHGGLFLWAAPDGSFVLSEPNGTQPSIYKIVRRRGIPGQPNSTIHCHHKNDTSQRFSEAVIHARGGGRKRGRSKSVGEYKDAEIVKLKIDRPMVFRDCNATDEESAEFYARRKIAETRRQGWSLTYTVPGHTTRALKGNKRLVWTPDTTVDLEDDEYGIYGKFWIESVQFLRNPKTTTVITLQRPEDLVFGTDQ